MLTLTHAIMILFFPHSYTCVHNLVLSLWTHLLGGETPVGWNHQVLVGLNPYFLSILFFNATMTISFCKEARDLKGSLSAPPPKKKAKKKVKKSWNLILDSIHSHHQMTIRIPLHVFFNIPWIFVKILRHLANLWQQTQNRGNKKKLYPTTTLLNSVMIMDGWTHPLLNA